MSEINNNYGQPVDIFALGNMNSISAMGVKENTAGDLQFTTPPPAPPVDSNYYPVSVTENYGSPAPVTAPITANVATDGTPENLALFNAAIDAAIKGDDAAFKALNLAPNTKGPLVQLAPPVTEPVYTAATVESQPQEPVSPKEPVSRQEPVAETPRSAPVVLPVVSPVIVAAPTATSQLGWSDTQALSYIASHGDLMDAFGANAEVGARHYLTYGKGEGRTTSFDPAAYLAANPDVSAYHTGDAASVTMHYIQYGRFENRLLAPAPVVAPLPPPSLALAEPTPVAPAPTPEPVVVIPFSGAAAPALPPKPQALEGWSEAQVLAAITLHPDLVDALGPTEEASYKEIIAKIIAQQIIFMREMKAYQEATLALRIDPSRVLQEYLQAKRNENRL